MSKNALQNIEQIESSLWEAADQLRANSKLTSSEYAMPVLGVIFLRQAANRYYAAKAAIEADQAAGKMPQRPLVKADFVKRRAMMLPKEAQFDELLKLPKGANLGEALVGAMNAIEAEFAAVPGLCRTVTRAEIAAADWSLTPGRYVGVAPPEEDEDFDFEQTLRDIHVELADLNREAAELAARIQENFEELGV